MVETNPYEYFPIQLKSYIILLVGIVSFVFGMVNHKNRKFINTEIDTGNVVSSNLLNLLQKNYIWILYVLTIVYVSPFAMRAIAFAAINNGVEMDDKAEVLFQGSFFARTFYSLIMYPMLHFAMLSISYMVLWYRNWLKISILVVFLLDFLALSGGRSFIVIQALYFIITYVCISDGKTRFKLSIKKVIMVITMVLCVIVGISVITNYRIEGITNVTDSMGDMVNSSTESLLSYLMLPIKMFDISITEDFYSKFGLQYGKATFSGLDIVIGSIVRKFGIDYDSTVKIVEFVQDNKMQIGSNIAANYAYTGNFYHYMDFGFLGVIIFPYLFGHLYRGFIYKFQSQKTVASLLLVCFCFFCMMHSSFSCYFIKLWANLFVIVLILLNNLKIAGKLSLK